MSRTESEKDAQARWIIRRDDPICTCKPENPKHREGWHCITPAHITAWEKATDGWRNTLSDRKRAAWLWLHFSQDPEARRLSGRVVTLEESDRLHRVAEYGLDAWDDAAGMSELEKRMFE